MAIIEVSELTKTFGQFRALNKVNLKVKEGEIHGFIGPNGAGKSTTIRILLGMLKADTGLATIFGKNAWKESVEIHEQIAYVPGEAKLWSNLTGGQVIDLLLDMRNQRVDTQRRDHLIEYFELDPTKKCRSYSKGNLQKVLIVAAFAAEADVYVLDEPTSGLDPLMERKFQTILLDLKNEGKTILLSSHILSEVEKLCDSVSIIRQGSIIETGSLEDLRHLMRYNYEVQTREKLEGIENISGVHLIEREEDIIKFQVDSKATNEILKFISQYDIQKLTSMPPKLEDLFIHYYEDRGDGNE